VLRPGSFREKVKVADLKRRAACAFDQRRAAMSRCFDAIIIGLGHAHVPLGNRLTRTGRATERMFFGGKFFATGYVATQTLGASRYTALHRG
jgi:hypothetical protein